MQTMLRALEHGFESGDRRVELGEGGQDFKYRLSDGDGRSCAVPSVVPPGRGALRTRLGLRAQEPRGEGVFGPGPGRHEAGASPPTRAGVARPARAYARFPARHAVAYPRLRSPTTRLGDVPPRVELHRLFVRFEDPSKQVATLRRWGYSLVSFGDLARLVAAWGAEGHVALTFDDGYADNSILPELGVPATVFVVSGSARPAPSRGARGAESPAEAIRALHAEGIEIGAHTVTHPDLTTLGYAEARSELERSKRELEAVLEEPVEVAAYRYGRANPDTVPAARDAGFRAACSTTGRGSWNTPLQLPRQDVQNGTTLLGLRMKRDGRYEPMMRLYPARAARKLTRALR